jgi:hypothetical protein
VIRFQLVNLSLSASVLSIQFRPFFKVTAQILLWKTWAPNVKCSKKYASLLLHRNSSLIHIFQITCTVWCDIVSKQIRLTTVHIKINNKIHFLNDLHITLICKTFKSVDIDYYIIKECFGLVELTLYKDFKTQYDTYSYFIIMIGKSEPLPTITALHLWCMYVIPCTQPQYL